MSYQIRYGDTTTGFVLNRNKSKRTGRLWFVLFCIILVAVTALFAKGYFIPGDSSVTRSAAKTFQQEIKDGEDIGNAFATFCKEIVDGAHLS